MRLHVHVTGPVELEARGNTVWLNARLNRIGTVEGPKDSVTFFLGDWVEAAALRDALSMMLRRECDRRNAETVKLQEAEEETAPA